MAQYKELPQTLDSIWEKNPGLHGRLEIGARTRQTGSLEEVPEDWEAPVELPARPGDPAVGLFKKMFG